MEPKMRSVSHGWKYVLIMETSSLSRLKQESVESVQLASKLINLSSLLGQSVLHAQQALLEATMDQKMRTVHPGLMYVLIMEINSSSRLKQESVESVQLASKLINLSSLLGQSVLHAQQALLEATMDQKMRTVHPGLMYVLIMEINSSSRLKQESVESVQLASKLTNPSSLLDQSVLHAHQVQQEEIMDQKMKIVLHIQKFAKCLGKQRLMGSVENALLGNG